jgi:RNA polymerase sigma factor (sigma-70 family)
VANKPNNSSSESSLLKYELNQALKRLPIKQSEALVYYEISGLSMDEIAKIQGITLNGIKTNISLARKTLALWLEEDETQTVINKKGVWYGQ